MLPEKRDPRINPVPGDVLQRKYQGQYFESLPSRTESVPKCLT